MRVSLLLASLCLPGLAHAEGDLSPIHLHVGGRELSCKLSPLADDDQIYVPLEVLDAVGAEGKLNRRRDAVLVTLEATGKQAELAIARPDGDPMIALSDLARLVNADILRTERQDENGKPIPGSKGDTVYLLSRITDVHLENGALHIVTSFPVPYHVHMIDDSTPPKGYVDCDGCDLPSDFHCAPLPEDETRATRLRAGQFSIDTARIVLEVTPGSRLRISDGMSDPDGTIIATLLRRRGRRTDGIASIDHPIASAPAGSQSGGAGAKSGSDTAQPGGASQDMGGRTTVQHPGMPTGDPQGASIDTDDADRGQNPLPSRGTPDRDVPTRLEVRGIQFSADNDTSVHVQITTTQHIEPLVHYLDGGDLAIDLPGATLNLPADQSTQKLPHPLLTGITAEQLQLNPPAARITLSTSRVIGFTVMATADGVSMDLRLPRNATGALADKLIVVDAGHGGHSTGATAGPIQEKNITLAIARKLRAELEACGARVVMTRDQDIDVGLDDRPRLANSIHADLFVSIHNDSNGVPNSASGTSTYYHNQDPSCRALAQCVQREILAVSGLPSRGVLSDTVMYHSGFAVLRESRMPAILVEVAYINNHRDRLHLLDEGFQERIAKAICRGLRDYVEGRPQTASITPQEKQWSVVSDQ